MRTKEIKIGNKTIGANNPILIQSMTTTQTADTQATIRQIKDLEEVGCDIIRVAIPNKRAVEALPIIKSNIHIPIIADIHYDYQLALESIENGVDKIRINPGNIGGFSHLEKILTKAKDFSIPIRIGVNAGSLEEEILKKYQSPTPEALVESMRRYVSFCEENDFRDLVLSIKASNVVDMIQANRLLSREFSYPIHLGVTEAGVGDSAIVKSSIGIGTLLEEEIGDTIRVSLTDNPIREVTVAKSILSSLNLMRTHPSPTLISCPTCGRTSIDLINIAEEVDKHLKTINKNISVAVMGCPVNGPGEAREADIGIAGANEEAILFKKGKIVRKVPQEEILEVLFDEIDKL